MEDLKKATPDMEYIIKKNGEKDIDSITFVDSVWKKNWNHIPRILFIDGTFLKNNVKGVLLIVMGMSGSKHQVPLALHYCKNESAENWRNFFVNIIKVFTDWLDTEKPLVIFSDRLIGLDSVLKELLPHSEHKYCMFHIVQNLKQKFKCTKDVTDAVYDISKSFTEMEFNQKATKLKEMNEKVYNYMMDVPLENWILCFCQYPNMLYITTSPIESFNRIIIEERKKPLVDLLIGIRKICSVSILTQKEELLKISKKESNPMLFEYIFNSSMVESIKKMYTPYFTIVNDKQKELSTIYQVEELDSYYTVTYNNKTRIVKYYVNEEKIYFICSCDFTKFSMIICRHIYSVMRLKPIDTSHLNNKIFTLYEWYQLLSFTYAYIERPQIDENYKVFKKPEKKSKRGRPKINRYKTTN